MGFSKQFLGRAMPAAKPTVCPALSPPWTSFDDRNIEYRAAMSPWGSQNDAPPEAICYLLVTFWEGRICDNFALATKSVHFATGSGPGGVCRPFEVASVQGAEPSLGRGGCIPCAARSGARARPKKGGTITRIFGRWTPLMNRLNEVF